MRFSELSQHIHELRYASTKRAIGRGMSFTEVWHAAISCPKNGVDSILYYETDLPKPFHGVFTRLEDNKTGETIVAIYVHKSLEQHWKEFVATKELMHCWSPGETRVGTLETSKQLVTSLTTKQGPYTPNAIADAAAVHAAAEVILPHYTAERHLEQGQDFAQIAFSHGLHQEIVEMICRHDMLQERKNGTLSGCK